VLASLNSTRAPAGEAPSWPMPPVARVAGLTSEGPQPIYERFNGLHAFLKKSRGSFVGRGLHSRDTELSTTDNERFLGG
jgi:hypothetical protein